MNSFLIALQFLTIIPITHTLTVNDKELGTSTLFYPVIGLLIGCLLAFASISIVHTSLQIQASVILILWVILSGGLHLDGLADCADAWVGGLNDKQRSLDIMKDPAAGPIAVIILVLLLLLKWSILCQILEKPTFNVLILTPMLGRTAILIIMLSTNYIRTGGLGEKIVANLPGSPAKAISLFAILIGMYYLGILSIIFMLLLLIYIGHQTNKRLGGVTGDVYGATVELTEICILFGAVIAI